jgi:hypothetical protein
MNSTTLASIRRTVLFVMIGSITATALLAIGTLLIGHFSSTQARILLTTLALAITSGLSLAGASSWPKQRTLPVFGIALASVAFVTALFPIWLKGVEGDRGWDPLIRTVGIAYVLAAAITYATLLISRRRAGERRAVRNTRLAALLSLAWLATMISITIASEKAGGSDSFGRAMGVAAVLTVATTLVTLILQRLEAPGGSETLSTGAVAGHTIVSVEKRKGGTMLVLDDGRRLPLARDLKLE